MRSPSSSTLHRAPAAPPPAGAAFNTTQWSLVLQAGGSLDSARALETLCSQYRPPIYAWVRRQGQGHPEAEDLTQEFFASLLRYDSLASVRPAKGRFRSFLLASLKHFLTNEWHRSRALKRGGGRPLFSLDALPGLELEAIVQNVPDSPEHAFDKVWAETLLARVIDRVRVEYEKAGQAERFRVLKVYLLAGREPVPYCESAAQLGLSEAAVKSAIYKLRRRYGEMLRVEIAQTLTDSSQVDDEIRCLLDALTR